MGARLMRSPARGGAAWRKAHVSTMAARGLNLAPQIIPSTLVARVQILLFLGFSVRLASARAYEG